MIFNFIFHRILSPTAFPALLIGVAGCSGIGSFQRPMMDMPGGVDVEQSEALKTHLNSQWWTVFHDSQLNQLMDQSLKYNRDLIKASHTVEKAVALSGLADSELYPDANFEAGAAKEELTRGQQYSQRLPSRKRDLWQMSGILSYELDLWGKLAASSEAAQADILSSMAARDAVRLRLTADVATTYITIRTCQEKCRVIQNVYESYQKSCAMYEKRFEAGAYPELELRRIQSERAKTLAKLKKAENDLEHAKTILSVLTGDSPEAIMKGRSYGSSNLLRRTPPAVPSNIPSDLLDRRPDLQDMESRLASAHYQEKSAYADQFPSISLTGRFGYVSTSLDNVLKSKSRLFSLESGLLAPLFDGGRRRSAVRVASAEYKEIEAAYEQSVMNAYREVKDALTDRRKSDEIYRAIEEEVRSTQRSWDIASKQYESGHIGIMDALDIHRSLLNCELDKAEAAGMRLTAVVRLCKALGGGWKREKK